MGLFKRLNTFLNSKKGNALLFTMVAAIITSMGGYLFVSVSTINDAQKQRITHLYNAYKMAEGITGKVAGTAFDKNNLDGSLTYDGIILEIGTAFAEGTFLDLGTLVNVSAVFVPDNDPTPEMNHGEENSAPYDFLNSGVKINYTKADGSAITVDGSGKSTDVVAGLKVLVNLAGTADIGSNDTATNHPYAASAPFYYVLMDNTEAGLDAGLVTITGDDILSAIISPETSVVIPSDAPGYEGAATAEE